MRFSLRLVTHVLPLALAPLAGCGPQPPAIQSGCAYPEATDLDPARDVVEYELTAAPHMWDPGTGTAVDGLAFNGQVPGPLLVARVGQTMRIRFTNNMSDETTIHWHGLRIPDKMDGVPMVQDPVGPGETFTYEFQVNDAGYYWYHPHMDSDHQVERGLAAPLLVLDPDEPKVACQALILDDVLLDDAGNFNPHAKDSTSGISGRLGNHLVVNGRDGGPTIKVTPGAYTLLRLVNSANTRHFHLRIVDHDMIVVGTDGGYIDNPYHVDRLIVAPGERYSVLVEGTGKPGQRYEIRNFRESAGLATDPLGLGGQVVATLEYGEARRDESEPRFPTHDIERMQAKPSADFTWRLGGMEMEDGSIVLTINGETWPDVTPIHLKGNQRTTLRIINNTMLRHPMHLHGQRFQVTNISGEIVPYTAWKDTVDVWPMDVITLVSDLDNPGHWMYHCHLLEHAHLSGMMAELFVD